ncbi:MAG: ABC transporter ATP-binding protein [Clostridia bacterium]|nr:ABC transporter ATP-binding protein [Clostridia bacterium]
MIELNHISVGYGKVSVLKDVNLKINGGRITTILGTNGCGKSTLLKTIVRLLPHTAGTITVENIPVEQYSPTDLAKKIAYLPQSKNIPEMTVLQMVLHGRFPHLSYPRIYRKQDVEIAEQSLKTLGIEHLASRELRELSGGMRQKAYIAMALAQKAPVILMDEPMTYLDIAGQLHLGETLCYLAKHDRTLVLVLHDLPLALKISDKIAVLHEGGLLDFGTPEEMLTHGSLERAYQIKIHPVHTENGVDYVCSL